MNKIMSVLVLILLSINISLASQLYGNLDGNGVDKIDLSDLGKIKSKKIVMFVHGSTTNHKLFWPLARELRARNYQSIFYDYNTDRRIKEITDEFETQFSSIRSKLNVDNLLIIGNSLGALVVRKVLEKVTDQNIKFISIAGPFGGIKKAKLIKYEAVYKAASMFFNAKKCYLDLASNSPFLSSFKALPENIEHIKIVTIEEGKQRYDLKNGTLTLVDDSILQEHEQVSELVDKYVSQTYEVKTGHKSAVNCIKTVSYVISPVLDAIGIF